MSRYDDLVMDILTLDDEGLQELYEMVDEMDDQVHSEYADVESIYRRLLTMETDHLENVDDLLDRLMEERDLFVEEDENDSQNSWSIKMISLFG